MSSSFRRLRVANDVAIAFGRAPADYQKPARRSIPMDPALRSQFNSDMSNLKAWKTAISGMPDGPGKTTLMSKYRERIAELLRNRASYKTFSRFI